MKKLQRSNNHLDKNIPFCVFCNESKNIKLSLYCIKNPFHRLHIDCLKIQINEAVKKGWALDKIQCRLCKIPIDPEMIKQCSPIGYSSLIMNILID